MLRIRKNEREPCISNARLGVAKDCSTSGSSAAALGAHKIGSLEKFKLSEVDERVRAGGADAPEDERGTRQ